MPSNQRYSVAELFFGTEHGGSMFLRKDGKPYTSSNPEYSTTQKANTENLHM
jgi:hypothetical protein